MAEAIAKIENPVLSMLERAKQKVVARLPQGMDHAKFFMGIMTAVQKSRATAQEGKSLADCDPTSVLLAAYEAAEVGCDLAPSLQLGWLIPYGKQAQFQPSYRFFIQKAYQTREVKTFFAEVVYEGDKFERSFAPEKNLIHNPTGESRVREKALGAYAFIKFTDGTIDFEYLTREQIEKHRNASKQPNSMKWTTFWEEGWRITPIRVMTKRLPLKDRDLEKMVELVNREAEDDLMTIPVENTLAEPTAPRRLSEKQETVTEKPAEKPAEKETVATEATEAKTEPEQKTEQAFTEDDYATGADIKEFWDKTLEASWKKSEVLAFLKKNFNVEAPKDLRRAQIGAALEMLTKARS